MDKKTIIAFLLAGVAGVLIGHFAWTTPEPPAATHESGRRPRNHVVDADSSGTIATLRRRVRELEQRLADTVASADALTNRTEMRLAEAEARSHGGPPNPENWRANLEEMKVNDPERYAQTTNRMAQRRSRMLQDRLEFFASLDTSTMTPKQRENHERLQDLLVRREELMRSMDISDEAITEAQRQKAHQEMRGLMSQLHAAERTERDMLLNQAARNLGCKGSVAKELVETVKTIYDATQSWGGGGGRRHGGGGGRPPPPPPQR